MSNIKIIVAAHKKVDLPSDKDLYVPIHVGAKGKEDLGYLRDDSGDNISHLNANYSELTGLYWAWKNMDFDVLGLVHYRRYFANKSVSYSEDLKIDDVILTKDQIDSYLKDYDVIVPKKRRYYIQTLYSHYADTHDAQHLDVTREIILEKNPDFLEVFDQTLKQRSGYMFNMFIMKKEYVNDFLSWMFPILEELSQRIDTTGYSPFDARYVGRVSEILFNVWLNKRQLNVKEVPFIYFDKVDFIKKGTAFLKAKFIGKKYNSSF